MSFGGKYELVYEKSQVYSKEGVDNSIARIKEMRANCGGPEILPPLTRVMTQEPILGYPRQIYLLTDGAVANTSAVISYVSQHNLLNRVHTIGIGDGCSQDLILGCAEMCKGYKTFISD